MGRLEIRMYDSVLLLVFAVLLAEGSVEVVGSFEVEIVIGDVEVFVLRL